MRVLARHTLIAFVLCADIACLFGSATQPATENVSRRSLTFAERVTYQRAIEEVYWRHRIWPKENPGPKPALNAVISRAGLEKKVEDYLRESQALENHWQRPITAEQLQAEIDRTASHTKQREVLRELFEALGNDPFVIAECLARPALVERLLTNWYACDQRIHGELRRRAEAELRVLKTVEQMKQLSGTYSEIELFRSDSVGPKNVGNAEGSTKLTSREWDATVEKLAMMFVKQNEAVAASLGRGARYLSSRGTATERRDYNAAEAFKNITIGKLSPLQEDSMRYYTTAVIEKREDRVKLATVTWPKEPLESWLARTEKQTRTAILATTNAYALPSVSGDICSDNTWTNMSTTPSGRIGHTAVWTGSEMILWGGAVGGADTATGWRYSPSTDTWVATTVTNPPTARRFHTAVWTGSEMIIFGGESDSTLLNTGARYNPSTDTWVPTTNLPSPRAAHTALWSGSEMIIWGGNNGNIDLNTGGRYNPNTNSWIATSTTNAPAARSYHTAVWRGNGMIVWGGSSGFSDLNTGGRYNPITDTWTGTSIIDAPAARDSHTAVWTGSEMIVWGGRVNFGNSFNTGGRYDPASNTWSKSSTTNAPEARSSHTAVWTGSEMIVWGGDGATSYLNTGGRYNPKTDSWTATATINAPVGRDSHTTVYDR